MNDFAAAYTASGESQLHCPLMTLPTEMRIMIYKFALQHILDDAYNEAPGQKKLSHAGNSSLDDPNGVLFYTGALALVHTNRAIRAEFLDTLATHLLAHIAHLKAEVHNADRNVRMVSERRHNPGLDLETVQAVLRILKEERERVDKLRQSAIQVKYISWAMGWEKGG